MNRQSANEKEKIDRHIVLDIDSEENFELFERLGKALSSRVRIRMLALLKHKSMNIVELAQELTIPVSSAAFHVNMLEEANLINTEMLPGVRGSQKVCSSRAEDVSTLLPRRRSGGHSAWICPLGIITISGFIRPAEW